MEMNNEIDKINYIIETKFLCEDKTVILESSLNSKGNRFYMKRNIVGHKSLVYEIYRFDPDNNNLFPYFSDIRGLKKICDYVIFVEDSKSLFIFLIELKKKSGSPERQLNISEDFIMFILNRAKSINCEINKSINIRKLGIKDSQMSQKRVTTYYRDFCYNKNLYSLIQSKSDLRLFQLINAPII